MHHAGDCSPAWAPSVRSRRRAPDVSFFYPFSFIAMATNSLDKNKIKFLLLEGIHSSAVDVIRAAGYTQIETVSGALPDEELKRKIADVHFVGIRSRTQLTEEVFAQAHKLVAVGCFCIGTCLLYTSDAADE